MRILGIDPGLARTGFAVLDASSNALAEPPTIADAGVFAFKSDRSVANRLCELERDLTAIIETHQPTHAAVEAIYSHATFPATAITMSHARGVILLCIERARIPLIELPANTVKKSVAGHGHASKEQVASAVAALLGLEEIPSTADITDAMAIAYCASVRFAIGD